MLRAISLSIESVSLIMEGQGIIESDNQGNYQIHTSRRLPAMFKSWIYCYRWRNRIESFFNVDIQGGDEATANDGYALADDGSLTITESQLVDELGVTKTAVVDVADANDAGFFAESGEGEWTYWPNEDFDGNLAMNVETSGGGEVSSHSLSIKSLMIQFKLMNRKQKLLKQKSSKWQSHNKLMTKLKMLRSEDNVADVTNRTGRYYLYLDP
ncbi:cadherin-like domain-containing protein [Vibrio chagasii]|nr:cadherin-like domain-containing protein [Vibrio chagasii]